MTCHFPNCYLQISSNEWLFFQIFSRNIRIVKPPNGFSKTPLRNSLLSTDIFVCVYVLLEAAAGECGILLCMCLVSFVSTEFLIKLSCITKQKTFQRSNYTHSIILSNSKFNHTKIWCRLLWNYFNPHSPLVSINSISFLYLWSLSQTLHHLIWECCQLSWPIISQVILFALLKYFKTRNYLQSFWCLHPLFKIY